jgi:GrpB-like predicted nucleotidyltransferase (UPF0157 family)
MLILPYNPEWIRNFEMIKEKLAAPLSGLYVAIEHIGSTAVPGLAAKPIIDIDMIYNEPADFILIKNSLESMGYYHNGDQDVEGREVFKRAKKTEDEILDNIPHHLYVCRYDCAELHRHLLFRDHLKKHETARKYYQSLKYDIAREAVDDRKLYAAMKELKAKSFIDEVIELSKKEHDIFGKIERRIISNPATT